ncbi:hypothetical protein L810_6300 [Burkholderia sp. AU4i]|nr:hypothetical protein L810_6300 [Burkholderia sp. AU4i]
MTRGASAPLPADDPPRKRPAGRNHSGQRGVSASTCVPTGRCRLGIQPALMP